MGAVGLTFLRSNGVRFAVLVVLGALSGCSATPELGNALTPSAAATSSIVHSTPPPLVELGEAPSGVPAFVAVAPVDAYLNIAHGAKICWFAPGRPLAGVYSYTADAQPDSKGGNAEIIIYTKEQDGHNGLRSFTITMEKRDQGTKLNVENSRIPEPLNQTMTADVARWIGGADGCEPVVAGWGPVDVPAKPGKAKPSPAKAAKPKPAKKS